MQRIWSHSWSLLIGKFQKLARHEVTLSAIRLSLCLAVLSQTLLPGVSVASGQTKAARVSETRPSVAVLANPVSQAAQGNALKPVEIQPVAKTVVSFKQLAEQDRKKAQSRKGTRLEKLVPIPAPMTIEESMGKEGVEKTFDPTQPLSDTIPGPNLPSPNPSTSFQGEFDEAVGGGPAGVFIIPPDTMGAVGINKVVSYLNNNLVVHNKTTGARLSVVGHDAFWASTGATGLFDPRIQYDPYQNRFLIAAVSNALTANSSIVVGISDTSDPEGTYTLFRFIVGCGPGAGCGQGEWADFPMLGFNKKWIAVGVNQFTINSSAFVAGKMLVLDYPALRTGTSNANIFTNASSATGFCMHPATTFSATEETLFVPTHQVSSSALYRLHTITGTAAAPVFTVDATARTRPGGGWTQPSGDNLPQQCVPGVGAPGHTCPATPRGAEAADSFIRSNVVFRNGLIWYAQSIALPAGGLTNASRFAAQWTALNPDASFNTGGRVEDPSAEILNGGKHYAYPSITVNKNNDVLLGFSEFESDDYIDAGYTFRSGFDAPGTMRDPVIYKEGEDYYQKTFSGSRNRWGDYSHSVIDPVNDGDLWTVQQYSMLRVGTTGQGSNDSRWSTWWAKVTAPTGVGDLIISEIRLYGPNGPSDEFIELYNQSGTALTVSSADGSAGLGVAASDGITRCIVPNGTVIPARGHYLCVNSAGYSLASFPAGPGPASGDATYTFDIPPNTGVAIFNNSTGGSSYSLANRIDAVGATSEPNPIYKEGTGHPVLSTAPAELLIDYSFFRKIDLTNGLPTDTDNNASDFFFVDTQGTSAGAGQRLGAPAPENLSGPMQRNGTLKLSLIDPGCAGSGPIPPPATPNACARQRDLTAGSPTTSTFGTLSIRRKVTNFTGGFVTRLRFRAVDTTTFPPSAGVADLRLLTSGAFTADLAGGGTADIQGLTLEEDTTAPNGGQPLGGGFNSTVSAGTITLVTPLAPGASINVHFLLGVQQNGSFRFFVNVEALP
ncbi:MAG TPA: lamin tail domain-containing protein [Pyrinomonadaceae bacterium]|nr:lamin tail domain-containing protein [Pyrinomonadaceae bacterium]